MAFHLIYGSSMNVKMGNMRYVGKKVRVEAQQGQVLVPRTARRAYAADELASAQRAFQMLKSGADVRGSKVTAARLAMATPEFEADHKLNVVVDRLLADLAL